MTPNIPSSPCRHRHPAGFTLIEVLMSVGIIALLAALVFPVLTRTVESSRTAKCASHLREIGKGLFAFAADHDGTLPPAKDNTKLWPDRTFMFQVGSYLDDGPATTTAEKNKRCFDGVFRCPGKKDWNLAGPTDRQKTSYGMNTFNPNDIPSEGKRLASIENPSATLLVADVEINGDIALRNAHYMYRDFKALRHQNRDNVLFCDGHVEALPVDSFHYQGGNGFLRK